MVRARAAAALHSALAPAAAALIATLSPAAAAAQSVRVEASLTAERVALGATTVLRVSVETTGAAARIELPALPPQVVVAGTQDFTQIQATGLSPRGRLIRKDVVLRAVAPGAVTIEPAVVHVDGRRYTTGTLLLEIDAAPAGSSPRAPDGNAEVMLRAWVEPDTVYVGDQIMLHAEALFAGDLRQRQSRPASYQAPSPTGFWVQDLADAVVAGTQVINGDVYESQTFRRVYFPLEAGSFTMEPARLVYELRRGLLQAPESRELVSESLPITVLSLPEPGRPDSFTGAVGTFEMTARLEPDTISAGEAVTLTVELSGRGNIKALPPPRLPDLGEAELFAPTEASDVRVVDGVVEGTKRFQWVIVPDQAGRLEIGPLAYGFFDPARERYGTARAPALTAVIAPAGRGPREPAALAPLSETRSAEPRLAWIRSPGFLAAQMLPLLILLGAAIIGRRGARGAARADQRRKRRERLARLDALRGQAAAGGPGFFGSLDDAVRQAVADALDEARAPTPARAATLASLDRVAPELARELHDLLAAIDRVRFAPQPPPTTERVRLVAEAKRLVERVARARRGAAAPVAAGALALACAATFGASAVGASAAGAGPFIDAREPAAHGSSGVALRAVAAPVTQTADAHDAHGDAFSAGLSAYRTGDFEAARTAFERHVVARPFDASGWYDLGNAYYRTGETGAAAWAWLRALAVEPRRADARYNLSVAGGPAADLVPPTVALTPEEAGLAIAVLWWAGALAIAAGWLRQPTRRAILAAAVLLAAGAAGAAVLTLPGRTAIVLDEQTPVLAGPAIKADELAALPVASPVRVIGEADGWTRVRTSDGIEGWVESALLGRL